MKKFRIVLVLALCAALLAFAACSPSISSLQKKFEKEGYSVEVVTGEEAEDEMDGATKALVATKILEGKMITCVWFKSEADAKDAEDDAGVMAGLGGMKVVRKGKMVAIGDEDSLKLL